MYDHAFFDADKVNLWEIEESPDQGHTQCRSPRWQLITLRMPDLPAANNVGAPVRSCLVNLQAKNSSSSCRAMQCIYWTTEAAPWPARPAEKSKHTCVGQKDRLTKWTCTDIQTYITVNICLHNFDASSSLQFVHRYLQSQAAGSVAKPP